MASCEELAERVKRRPVTTLLVTHNVEEAVRLADRLLLLSVSPARILAESARMHYYLPQQVGSTGRRCRHQWLI
jgi:ABC-type nitrate/sulfonate/bicarbonate transport system ATPase subunit